MPIQHRGEFDDDGRDAGQFRQYRKHVGCAIRDCVGSGAVGVPAGGIRHDERGRGQFV